MDIIYWIIAIPFIAILIFIYGGLIISSADDYKNKKFYYVIVFLVLIGIIALIWLTDKGYTRSFLESILPSSAKEYTPGECYPYGSCD